MTKRDLSIDILTMFLYMSLFLISSGSFNGRLISLGSVILAVLIPVLGSLEDNGKIKIKFGKVKYYYAWPVLFLLFCYASALWAIQPNLAISKGNSIFKNIICVTLVYLYYRKINNIKRLLRILMYGGYSVIILSIMFYGVDVFSDAVRMSTRLSSDFLNSNTLAMLAAFTIIINLYFILYYREEKKMIVLAVISLIVLAAAGSRKGILELGGGVILLFIVKNYNGKKFLSSVIKIIFVGILIFIAGYFLLKLPMFDFVNMRMENLMNLLRGSGTTDFSVKSRASLDEFGLELFLQHPILGIGIDCARIPVMQTMGRDWYLHNNFLELLVDGGIVGFCIFYSIYAVLFYQFIKLRNFRDAEYDISLILMTLQFVLSFAYVTYYSRETYFYLLIYILEIEILHRKNKSLRQVAEKSEENIQ